MSTLQRYMAAGAALCGLLVVPAPPQQPPPLPIAPAAQPTPEATSGCRCDIVKRKLDALIDKLMRKGVIGAGAEGSLPQEATAPLPIATAPLVTLPGTTVLGHGPYRNKEFKPSGEGRWWTYKRCFGGDTCITEWYWVPGE